MPKMWLQTPDIRHRLFLRGADRTHLECALACLPEVRPEERYCAARSSLRLLGCVGYRNSQDSGATMKADYLWKESYQASILETDRNKLPTRIQTARAAIDETSARVADGSRRDSRRTVRYCRRACCAKCIAKRGIVTFSRNESVSLGFRWAIPERITSC